MWLSLIRRPMAQDEMQEPNLTLLPCQQATSLTKKKEINDTIEGNGHFQ